MGELLLQLCNDYVFKIKKKLQSFGVVVDDDANDDEWLAYKEDEVDPASILMHEHDINLNQAASQSNDTLLFASKDKELTYNDVRNSAD